MFRDVLVYAAQFLTQFFLRCCREMTIPRLANATDKRVIDDGSGTITVDTKPMTPSLPGMGFPELSSGILRIIGSNPCSVKGRREVVVRVA